MPTEIRFLVLGGGITGLCSAYYLAKHYRPENVLLLEGGPSVGGVARSDRMEGFVCEWGPNGWVDKEPKLVQWLKDLGLHGKTITAREDAKHRFLLRDGKLHELKPPPALFTSPLLSAGGKLRLMREPLTPRKKTDAPESLHDFIARRAGSEAAETFAQVMANGVFAGDAKKLSVEHAFPTLAKMEREHGSLFNGVKAMMSEKKPMGTTGELTSFPGGMQTLSEAAAAALGDRIRTNEPVVKIELRDGKYLVTTQQETQYLCEGLVLAVPAFVASRLMGPLDKRQGAALGEIQYAPILVFCTGFKRQDVGHDLKGFGFLVPRDEPVRAIGCLWSSSIFDGHARDGYVLLRTMYGGALDPKAIELSDRDLLAQFTREMAPILKLTKQPDFGRIYRHPRGIPQYDLNHAERLRTLDYGERQFPGLVYAGNAYRGVGINDCIVDAHRAVKLMKERWPF
jgi:oxygen-dependent protoporphyrinogen oxidase